MKKMFLSFFLIAIVVTARNAAATTLLDYERKINFSSNISKMVLVRNDGSFIMGSKESVNIPGSIHASSDELPWRHIVVDSFYMDQYEATVSEVTDFLAHKYFKAGLSAFKGANLTSSTADDQAFNIGTWSLAEEYCRYKGKRLPTEAEWEKAAQAGQNLVYSTANGKLDPSLAKIFSPKDSAPGPVGQYPPNPFGIYDMTGNASEWVLDWYYKEGYFSCMGGAQAGRICYNPVALEFPKKDNLPRKVHRGGYYGLEVNYVYLTSYRGCLQPELAWANTGVRCVLPQKYVNK